MQLPVLETLQTYIYLCSGWNIYVLSCWTFTYLHTDQMLERIWPIHLLSRHIGAVFIYIMHIFQNDDFDIWQYLVSLMTSSCYSRAISVHTAFIFCASVLSGAIWCFFQLCLPSLKYINVLWEGKVTGTEMSNYNNDQLLFLFILRSISINGSVNGYFPYIAAIYINFWGKTHLM